MKIALLVALLSAHQPNYTPVPVGSTCVTSCTSCSDFTCNCNAGCRPTCTTRCN